MGYLLDEQAMELVNMVQEFCGQEIKKQCHAYDISGEFPGGIMDKLQALELHMIEIPKKYGGIGLDVLTVSAIYEKIAEADSGIAIALACSALALKPALIGGNEAQVEKIAQILLEDGYGAFAVTEPMAGSDAASMRTSAEKSGKGYVLNGEKCMISNGGIASVYIIFAMTNAEKGTKGISAFIVERGLEGVSTGAPEDKMGLRLSNTASVFLEDVYVPEENRIGKEGEGFKIAMQALDIQRAIAGAIAIGVAQRAFEEAAAYAKERQVFGKPLIKNQAIQFMLADMDMQIETARQMVAYALALQKAGKNTTREAAMAKCCASDMAVKVALDAVQILGSYGYSREYPVEKLVRDAKAFQILEGPNQVMRMIIGGRI